MILGRTCGNDYDDCGGNLRMVVPRRANARTKNRKTVSLPRALRELLLKKKLHLPEWSILRAASLRKVRRQKYRLAEG